MTAAASGSPAERLRMVRPDLDNLPEFPLPPGFRLRGYRTGDRSRWEEIIAATQLHLPVSPGLHQRAFGPDEDELARRQLFLVAPEGEVMGTATAWFGSAPFASDWGRVHWVAVLPRWQGRDLSKPLLASTLERLRNLGHSRSYLITEPVRLPAINLYLKFGFTPEIDSEAEAQLWRNVLAGRIRIPNLPTKG